jgi:hypothetical protein
MTGSDRRLASDRNGYERPATQERSVFSDNLQVARGLEHGVQRYLEDLRSRVQLLQVPTSGRSHAPILTRRQRQHKLPRAGRV